MRAEGVDVQPSDKQDRHGARQRTESVTAVEDHVVPGEEPGPRAIVCDGGQQRLLDR
jgi:hypothetical protein